MRRHIVLWGSVALAVSAAFAYSGYALTTRLLSSTESPQGLLIYGSLLSALALTPALPVIAVAPPTWLVAAALAMTGLTGAQVMPLFPYIMSLDLEPLWHRLICNSVVTGVQRFGHRTPRLHPCRIVGMRRQPRLDITAPFRRQFVVDVGVQFVFGNGNPGVGH